nr:MAG TPA: DNA-binding domain protein [Caudoviricetes sp.]
MKIKLSRKEFLTIYNALCYKENSLRINTPFNSLSEKVRREIIFINNLQANLMLKKINNYWRHRNENQSYR